MRRVRTIMTGVAGSPFYTSMYFDGDAAATTQDLLDRVEDFWTTVAGSIRNDADINIQGDVETIDVATGEITGVVSGVGATVEGTVPSPWLPPATQALMRLRTNDFQNSRRVQGRIFIPGLGPGAGTEVPSGPARAAFDAAAETLRAASEGNSTWSVYSPTYRVLAEITAVSTWEQYAVLRSRRD